MHGRDTQGFSLIEAVMVVAIIGALAGIVLPRFADAQARYRATATARRVAADLELARAHARANSASVTVAFDVADQSYSLSGVTDPDDPAAGYVVDLGGDDHAGGLISANFGGAAQVTFDGYGAPSSGGSILVGKNTLKVRVKVFNKTGRIEVIDGFE